MRLATLVATCFITLVTTATVVADQTSDEIRGRLAGIWEVEEGINQGIELSEAELEGTTMKIDQKTIVTYDRDKNEKYRSTFTIDASTTPISIDMVTIVNGMPPVKSFGILKFDDDDKMTLCYALPGGERPKDFESPKGSKVMLFECEKED